MDPATVQKWLFVGPSSKIVDVDINLKKGGTFSILELDSSNGTYIDHFGEYEEIEPTHKLSFTLSVPWHFDGVTQVVIEIESEGEGSILTLTQTGVSPEKTEKTGVKCCTNWTQYLHKIKYTTLCGLPVSACL